MARRSYQQVLSENRQLAEENRRLQERVGELEAEVERLKKQAEEARRGAKRQAAPFSKGDPKANPKKPGRKRGAAYGPRGSRPVPKPSQIDEVYEAPLPGCCADCGGELKQTEVLRQAKPGKGG